MAAELVGGDASRRRGQSGHDRILLARANVRMLQRIKDQIVGPEVEAVEL
jgi:hypothetical protein